MLFNYEKTLLNVTFELRSSEPLKDEFFSSARLNAIRSGNIYIGRFADSDFVDSRSSTFLEFKGIKPAFFHFIYILEAVTGLILAF